MENFVLKTEIRQIGFIEYMETETAEAFPASARFHASLALKNEGYIFCSYVYNSPVGICIINPMGGMLDVLYLFVQQPYRRLKIASSLIAYCKQYAARLNKQLCLRIINEHEFSDALFKIANKNGLTQSSTSSLFVYDDLKTQQPVWKNFWLSRGYKINSRLKSRGFETCSFDNAPIEIINSLKTEIGRSFPGYLNPFRLCDRNDRWSFVTYKDNIPYAFSAASLIENKLILEQLSIHKDYHNTGVFLLPLSYFINQAFDEKTARVTYVVYNTNKKMKKLTDGFLSMFTIKVKHQISFVSTLG